jgi:acetyltransferase
MTGPSATSAAQSFVVERLSAETARGDLSALASILADVVDGGASVGFLPPLAISEAMDYWRDVIAAVDAGTRVLMIARASDGAAIGALQIDLCTRPNGRHRAEVMKVMVPRAARRRGIGRALMLAAEDEARRLGVTTLVLDTRLGDPSEALYTSVGYVRAGVIPRYARSADGTLHATAFYYRLLETDCRAGACPPPVRGSVPESGGGQAPALPAPGRERMTRRPV